MSLLQNDGDIIFDVVLTDAGRERLARGDGSFKIVKFALGDAEINYADFQINHPSGSAYQDINILSTPVFEAFTDNAAVMKYKLVTYGRNDLLYLPIIKLSTVLGPGGGTYGNGGFYVVTCNNETITALGVGTGVIDGQTAESSQRTPITFEQGLDTTEISSRIQIPNDLKETQYLIQIDSRMGEIIAPRGSAEQAEVSFIDDDKKAVYLFTMGGSGDYIREIGNSDGYSIISGPRGTVFQFGIRANINLNTSNYLFTRIGNSITIGSSTYYYIDTIVRIIGGTTGYSIDLPIRFLRKQ